MKTINRNALKKKVIQGKADPKSLVNPKKELPKDDSLKKIQGTLEQVLQKLPTAMMESALSITENTKAVISLAEFMKRQKEMEKPIVVNIEGAKGWKFELYRDSRNLLKTIDADRKD